MAGILLRRILLPPWAEGMLGVGGVTLAWGNGTSCWVLGFRQTNLTEQGKVLGLAFEVGTLT